MSREQHFKGCQGAGCACPDPGSAPARASLGSRDAPTTPSSTRGWHGNCFLPWLGFCHGMLKFWEFLTVAGGGWMWDEHRTCQSCSGNWACSSPPQRSYVWNSRDHFITQGWSWGPSRPVVARFNSGFGHLAPVVSDPRLLRSRSTPRGAVSFDVHATPAVTVHMIHSPTTKPTMDSRWPLDPDIEVVVTIDVTSRTIDDNQVRCCLCAQTG